MLGRSMEEANPSAVMVFFSANKNNVQAHQDKPLEETARQEYQVLPYLISVACSPTMKGSNRARVGLDLHPTLH